MCAEDAGVYAGDPAAYPHYTNGVKLIEAERVRQIAEEGYDIHHDDGHVEHELRCAAISYIAGHTQFWPDGWEWKPRDELTNLVRAGALVAAEIDRLLRAQKRVEDDHGPLVRAYEPTAIMRVRELEDMQQRKIELTQTVRDMDHRIAELSREVSDARCEHQAITAELDDRNAELRELRLHSSRLVELLGDAWWVEAAYALDKLKELSGVD